MLFGKDFEIVEFVDGTYGVRAVTYFFWFKIIEYYLDEECARWTLPDIIVKRCKFKCLEEAKVIKDRSYFKIKRIVE